jgi:hypothetical protein
VHEKEKRSSQGDKARKFIYSPTDNLTEPERVMYISLAQNNG